MFHVKQGRSMFGFYRRWRHTRHVRRWRPFFEEKRYWDRMLAAAGGVDTIAEQLR